MHRAETILNAIEAALDSLATTGARVVRGRNWPVAEAPAISIMKGADSAEIDDAELAAVIRELEVNIVIHTQSAGNQETELNQIATEVYAALRSSPLLGLDFVFDTLLTGDSAPEFSGDDQDLPVGQMISTYNVIYEHDDTTTEA